MTLGLLDEEDAGAALALSAAEGWNQTEADWRRMIRLEASGCFSARDGRRLIGTVTTTTYGRAMAWIGMMVVHPDYRRQGIGAALMRLALDYLHGLGVPSIGLDATPAGRPLYESLGFTAEADVERWQGIARPEPGSEPGRSNDGSVQALFALDRAAHGVDRSRLLELLVPGGALMVSSAHGVPEGFALARPGRAATYIGPVIATTAGAAGQLLNGTLARFAGEEICLDLCRSGWLEPGVLAERGLSKRRGLTRMRHGPRVETAAAQSICASAGPEFG